MVFKLLRLGFAWFYLSFIGFNTYWPAEPAQPNPAGGWLVGWFVGWLAWLVNWLVGWLAGWLAGRSLAQQAPRAFPLTFNKDLMEKREGIGQGSSRSICISFQ